MRNLLLALACAVLPSFAAGYSLSIDTSVDAHTNLFYSDWGHWFTQAGDRGLNEPGSQAASAVTFGGSGFNFATFDTLAITAGGSAVEDGDAAFDPDGACVSGCGNLYFGGGDFRAPELSVYSLIGIWSKSATAIDPFYGTDYGWRDIDSGLGLLLIGSGRELVVPDFESAYLFLAVNDGGFADNSGAFDVHIAARVPEPAPLALLALGMLALGAVRYRAS